jgi:hypothetical protein
LVFDGPGGPSDHPVEAERLQCPSEPFIAAPSSIDRGAARQQAANKEK